MEIEMRVTEPENVEVTTVITMPLRSWRALREEVAKAEVPGMGWRHWMDLCGAIRDITERMDKVLTYTEDTPDA